MVKHVTVTVTRNKLLMCHVNFAILNVHLTQNALLD